MEVTRHKDGLDVFASYVYDRCHLTTTLTEAHIEVLSLYRSYSLLIWTIPRRPSYQSHFYYILGTCLPTAKLSATMVQSVPIVNEGNVVQPNGSHQNLPQKLSNGFSNNGHAGSNVLHRSLHHDPVQVESAQGNLLYLSNGQRIFDATGGAAVACLGHGDERSVHKPIPRSRQLTSFEG